MYYFETIKCDDFEIFNLHYHEERVAKTIGLNLNLREYIYPSTSDLYRCKVIYNEDGIEDVLYFKYEKREIKSFKIIVENNINYSKKYMDRTDIDNLYKQKEKADEIIIIKNDLLTDTSIANIAIHDGSSWITPKKPLLFGTTRARLIEEKVIFEKDIDLSMLKEAKKVALMNAMIGFDILEDYSFFL